MAALMSLTQISNGNQTYENFYRQVDPGNTGSVSASDAAQFLKKSGLSDSTLGKIWDLADSERKGFLDKRGFFIALRLVASAQSGNDVSHNSLNQTLPVPPPKFKDVIGTSLITAAAAPSDSSWTVRSDERAKFDGIFESLSPVNGLLSGEKVKPVLINSKLPLDVLGRIWDLSDIDKDGHLDREEFAVVMHLVYRAREKEAIPATLPHSLIPPSKRKKAPGALPGAVPVLPSSPFPLKESLRSTPSHTSKTSLSSTGSLSPKHSFRSSTPPQPSVNWVVPLADRGRYDDIFEMADSDFDGLVGGAEVKDIFFNSGLPQGLLAHIWSLSDTKQMGKLSMEQFSLAMHLIQQKVTKGLDPPQALTPDMLPPSERGTPAPSLPGFVTPVGSELAALARRDSSSSAGAVELTGIKELDDISQEISQLQREKYTLEKEIRDKEEAIRQKTSEVQDMQGDLERESSSLQDLESQKQDGQDRLQEMDQQRAKLEGMLTDAKLKCQEETTRISSLQTQILSQETDMQAQEKELSRTKTDLYCLEQEESQLEENLRAGRARLESIIRSLSTSQDEINQARSKLSQIQESQEEVTKSIEQYNKALNGSRTDLADLTEELERENGGLDAMEDHFRSKVAMFNSGAKEVKSDPFQSEDPFKTDPFNKDPFGGDPFKENDPFKAKDPFASSDPFGKSATTPSRSSPFCSSGSFTSASPKPKDSDVFGTTDPFGSDSFGGKSGFADFGQMSKGFSGDAFDRRPSHPKKTVPPKPAPPPYCKSMAVSPGLGERSRPFHSRKPVEDRDPFSSSSSSKAPGFANFGSPQFGSEAEQLEWAKRESERAEQERLKRLRQQEQEDLELAIALSRSNMPGV